MLSGPCSLCLGAFRPAPSAQSLCRRAPRRHGLPSRKDTEERDSKRAMEGFVLCLRHR